MIVPVLFFVAAVAMGATFIWDIGGLASKMRADLDESPLHGALHRRLPSWAYRAFGVWCIIFGTGVLVYFYGLAHGAWR